MPRIFVPSGGVESWQRLLADPVKHWREGYSARSLAGRWEAFAGLPDEIETLLAGLHSCPELLFAVPEHKVALPGSARGESQNDLFALIGLGDRVGAFTIEGKVDEPFGPTMDEWLANASPGKLRRLSFLRETLGIGGSLPGGIRYQLLHRTASAVIERKRFRAHLAGMIVHSFSSSDRWFEDFAAFVDLFGKTASKASPIEIGPNLYVGWASGA